MRVLAGLNGLDSRNSSGRDGYVLESLLDDDHADNIALGNVLGPDGGETIVLRGDGRRLSNSGQSFGGGADGVDSAFGSGNAELSSLEDATGHVVSVGDSGTLGVSSSWDFDSGGVRSSIGRIGGLRSVSNLDTAGKGVADHSGSLLVERALEHLGDLGVLVKGALVLLSLALDVEDGAVLDSAAEVGAGVNGLLEQVLVPAVHEVGVVAEALNITIGIDELARLSNEVLGSPDGLVHETRDLGLEALGAVAVHNKIGVGQVVPVVIRIEILAVPARREHDFGANAVGAVGIEVVLVGHVVTVQGALRLLAVVEAVETGGTLSQVELRSLSKAGPFGLLGVGILDVGTSNRVVAAVSVSGNHAESGRERLDATVGVGSIRIKEVVRQHTTNLGNELKGAVGMLEVERRSPVRRHILGDSARSAITLEKVIVGRLVAEAC